MRISMKVYVFGVMPVKLLCGGGGGTPAAPLPPPPPAQLAKTPDAPTVRANTATQNIGQGGGEVKSTLITGGMGDTTGLDKLGKKTLLGQAATAG